MIVRSSAGSLGGEGPSLGQGKQQLTPSQDFLDFLVIVTAAATAAVVGRNHGRHGQGRQWIICRRRRRCFHCKAMVGAIKGTTPMDQGRRRAAGGTTGTAPVVVVVVMIVFDADRCVHTTTSRRDMS